MGANILDGVTRLARDHPDAGLQVVDAGEVVDGPALAHAFIGENTRPESKIGGFDRLLAGSRGAWAEVALFKFCYADFTAQTDVPRLFEIYARAHEVRKAAHPRVLFVHVTAPLTTVQRGPKAWLRKRAGSAAWGERENERRNQYNNLLRRQYGSDPLFDLARFEAVGRGERLADAYTDDGGHLNEVGQAAVAEQLVVFLSTLPGSRR